MNNYYVSTANETNFNKIVDIITSKFPDAVKEKKLIDVDDTIIQPFTLSNKKIMVSCCEWEDEIWVKSDIDLSDIDFKSVLN